MHLGIAGCLSCLQVGGKSASTQVSYLEGKCTDGGQHRGSTALHWSGTGRAWQQPGRNTSAATAAVRRDHLADVRVQGPQVQLRQRSTLRGRRDGVRHADEPGGRLGMAVQGLAGHRHQRRSVCCGGLTPQGRRQRTNLDGIAQWCARPVHLR